MRPIKINTKDVWKFGLIALLVDREDFLHDVELSRKTLVIKTLLLRKNVKKEWNDASDALTAEKYKKLTNNQKRIYNKIHSSTFKLIAPTPYDEIVISLTKKYHRSDSFQEVIRFSILCGEVEDEDFNIPQPLPWHADPKKEITYIPIRHPQIALVVNSETNPEEVKKFFLITRKPSKYSKNPFRYMSYLGDTKTKIMEHRDWYWQNKRGKTAQEIYNSLPQRFGNSLKSVEAAITTYKKLLNSSVV
ncbi:hypothetical protein HZA75_03230 [Candidatus Roizmanbacteria bacterium]|nr:hypothetical protein [Candidatus Roizmanbacteria bacterium]